MGDSGIWFSAKRMDSPALLGKTWGNMNTHHYERSQWERPQTACEQLRDSGGGRQRDGKKISEGQESGRKGGVGEQEGLPGH